MTIEDSRSVDSIVYKVVMTKYQDRVKELVDSSISYIAEGQSIGKDVKSINVRLITIGTAQNQQNAISRISKMLMIGIYVPLAE